MKKLLCIMFFVLFNFTELSADEGNVYIPTCELHKGDTYLGQITGDGEYLGAGVDGLINLVIQEKCHMPERSVCYIFEDYRFKTDNCPYYYDYYLLVNGIKVKLLSDFHTCDYGSAGRRSYGYRNALNKIKKFKRTLTNAGVCN